ncbi:hypothetical protein tpqmel_0314, partial [Candidatus Gastranaerophilus sp. (ex Termes propinquus)]
PDGQRSVDKLQAELKKALECGRSIFDWTYKLLDGTEMPVEANLVRVKHGNEYLLAGYTRDLREQTELINEINHRDNMLSAINKASLLLLNDLNQDAFEDNIHKSMGLIAKAVDVERMYIFKNNTGEDGELYCNQLFEWSEGASSQQGTQFTRDIKYFFRTRAPSLAPLEVYQQSADRLADIQGKLSGNC